MNKTDKILATLSIVALVIFIGIVVIFVRELDLAIVVFMCLMIGVYDFWSTFRAKSAADSDKR